MKLSILFFKEALPVSCYSAVRYYKDYSFHVTFLIYIFLHFKSKVKNKKR